MTSSPTIDPSGALAVAGQVPPRPKQLITDLIDLTIYWLLARLAVRTAGLSVACFP